MSEKFAFHSFAFSLIHSLKKCGGGGIRTYSAVKHQIYSLARLSGSGAPPWNITLYSLHFKFEAFLFCSKLQLKNRIMKNLKCTGKM